MMDSGVQFVLPHRYLILYVIGLAVLRGIAIPDF
jgi:hypothetical protein